MVPVTQRSWHPQHGCAGHVVADGTQDVVEPAWDLVESRVGGHETAQKPSSCLCTRRLGEENNMETGGKEMFYLTTHSTHFIYWKEGNVLFNDALNTFYLLLYGMNECLTTPQHKKQIGYWVSYCYMVSDIW